MNSTVVWKPEAERNLAAIWNRSADRNAAARATPIIDQTLGTAPQDAGESREEGFRVLLVRPLGVMFEVSPDDRTVRVVAVWTFE